MSEKTYRPMTDDERAVARAFAGVTFQPATNTKRFAREMASIAQQESPAVTDKQGAAIFRTAERFRRQLPRPVLEIVARHVSVRPT